MDNNGISNDVIRILLNEEYESSFSSSSSDSEDWEYKEIITKVENINDLIKLGEMYNSRDKIKYNIDVKKLHDIIEPLKKLKSMIGLKKIKDNIVGHIIYYMQNLDKEDNMMHTVIQGPPGVGKTMLGKIIGELYYKLGILKGNKKRNRKGQKKEDFVFKVVRRSDLIAKYVGQTAIKTQKVIDSCRGGVMFIDEAYSLGTSDDREGFSKECIDTINQNLTENKTNFLCIIAGYKDSLDKCFFSYNEGLRRRFTFKYEIETYTPKELRLIFIKMINDIEWIVKEKNIPLKFFEDNYDSFKHLAGDMETLLLNCKIEHSKRVFCFPKERKILSYQDIKKGFKIFAKNRGIKKKDDFWKNIYI